MANERCTDCGAVIALVGIRHNCIPKSDGAGKEAHHHPSQHGTTAAAACLDGDGKLTAASGAGPSDSKTYRYRNADKRRADMREYMKKWRAKRAAGRQEL